MTDARREDLWLGGFAVALVGLPILAYQLLSPVTPTWLPAAIAAAIAIGGFIRWPVRGLVIIALYLLLIDTVEIFAGTGIKLVDELVVPLIALITLLREYRRIPAALSVPREVGVILIVGAALASSLVNGVALATWLPGLLLLVKGIAVFYIARLLPVSAADVRWAMRVVLGLGLVILAFGLVELVAPQVFTALGLRPSEARAGLPAIKSLFYHQQLFGWFCGFLALFLYAHHVILGKRWMLVLALLFSVGTILSARRRAIVGIVAGLFAGIVADLTRGRDGLGTRMRHWVPSTVGMLVLSAAFLPALAGLYQLTVERYVVEGVPGVGGPNEPATEVDAASAPARVALYGTSVLIARDDFPFGAGLGRFGSWMSRTDYSEVYAKYDLDHVFGLSPQNPQFITDTFWPQILGEAGVIGLIGYGLFLATLGLSIRRQFRRPSLTPMEAAVVLSTGLIFVQTLAESLASPIFNSPPQIYLIMLTIGGVMGWQARAAAGDAEPAATPDRAPAGMPGGAP